jgi:hypothetical protein
MPYVPHAPAVFGISREGRRHTTHNEFTVSHDRKSLTRIRGRGVLDATSIGKGMCGEAMDKI